MVTIFEQFVLELVSKELNHFGVIAGLFRQIGGHSKGQLISEWIYEAKTSPKKWTKNCKDFCPVSEGRNPCNFSFVFWEKFWLHKFILKLTDL